MHDQKTIFVGLSGGVDSSVAALRLKQAGHNVVGVFIKVWQPDFLVCNWEAERLDAMRVAAHLDIPFVTFDAVDAYKTRVADYLVGEYQKGRTPNPDVMCNEFVKFGAFLDFALSSGADMVATGHYARVRKRHEHYELLRGLDTDKDQSYFLWMLSETQLAHTYFPVGNTNKIDIRNEAKRAGLPTFAKRDSQGICFLGQVDMKEFLSHYITETTGQVLDKQGSVIGTHRGALFYTLGERHGFTLTEPSVAAVPQYVVGKDTERNTITVSSQVKTLMHDVVVLDDMVLRGSVQTPVLSTAQFRYRQRPFPVQLLEVNGPRGKLTVDAPTEAPSVGQSCVIYHDDVCIGGGIIS